MAQWLGALACSCRCLSSVPSAHIWCLKTACHSNSRGSNTLLASLDSALRCTDTHENTYSNVKQIFKNSLREFFPSLLEYAKCPLSVSLITNALLYIIINLSRGYLSRILCPRPAFSVKQIVQERCVECKSGVKMVLSSCSHGRHSKRNGNEIG